MRDYEKRDEENPNPSLGTPRSASTLPLWKKGIEICMLIVGGILVYCLLTMGTIVIVSIFLSINTILYIILSLTGDAGSMKVVSPIRDSTATVILLVAIITLSVWLGIVQGVGDWKHNTLVGVEVGKWLKVFIIVFSYYSFWTGAQILETNIPMSDKWLQALLDAICCVLLFPAVVLIMTVVPSWKHHTILGLLTWKWILALVMVTVSQNAISIGVRVMVFSSQLCWCGEPKDCKSRNCMYYYINGLRRSITFVLVSLMHLLTWNLYFRHRFTRLAITDKVLDFGTWTFVSELIFGVLWGIKTFILLSWKAHTVYARSDKEILRKLTQWNLLCSLELIKLRENRPEDKNIFQPNQTEAAARRNQQHSEWERYKIINSTLRYLRKKIPVDMEKIEKAARDTKEIDWRDTLEELHEVVKQYNNKVNNNQNEDGILSIHVKEMIAWAFLPDVAALPEDEDIYDQDTRNPDNKRDTSKEDDENPTQSINKLRLKIKKLKTDDMKIFIKQLQEMNMNAQAIASDEIAIASDENATASDELIKTWMERAWQNCSQLQYLLTAAREVLNFLDRLMIGFMIALIIIIWLLLTELVSTKVIVVISSPLLAATFIFGDTLKTMFQGIVYAYMMHPFTVGDVCAIDQTLMEVKHIGIWRTTFSKVGTEEEILYPNSALASQAVINYAGDSDFVLKDTVEFSIDYDTKWSLIDTLKGSIKSITIKQLSKAQHEPEGAVKAESLGSALNGSDQRNALAGVVQKDDKKVTEPSGSELHSQGSAARDDNQIEEQPLSGSEPSAQVDQVPEVAQSNTDDDVEVVVRQVQYNIKMTVHFKHDKSILDMTNTKAFHEKLRRKSNILEAIAQHIKNPQSSTYNAKEAEDLRRMNHEKKIC